MRKAIHTDDAPAAIGPYSQAIEAGGWLWCSGQIALKQGQIVGTTAAEQAAVVLDNLTAVLAAGGATFDQVVRCTIFLKSMDDFAAVNEVYGARMPSPPPARAAVEVARLPKDVLVEIDAVAYVGG
ncbi:MAG: Rid family detoxifying hydrolase [Bradymonadia bacterium]